MMGEKRKLRAPSFARGDNAIPGVPSRIEGERLWVRGRSAAGGCFVWAGIAFSLVPLWVGMSMREQEPRWMWVGLAMSLAAIATVVIAGLYRWEEYVIADRAARTFQTVRLATLGSWYGPVEPVPEGGVVTLLRFLQARREYYGSADLAPGETLYTFWGPTQLNVRWHELVVLSQGGDKILLLSDEPLPASHVELFRIAGRGISQFMGLPFADYSRELTEFEKSLPREHAPIEYIALPHDMRHFDTKQPICVGCDWLKPT